MSQHNQPQQHDAGAHAVGQTGDRSDHHTGHGDHRVPAGYDPQREQYGGINWGAAFFGWLVAIAITVLLASIIGAIATAVGSNLNLTESQAADQAGTLGLAAAITLLVVLLIAYFTGGYVAGRMSRFDGGKQGLAVWVIGLVVTILAALAGWLFGSQYNIFQQVNMPSMPIPTDTATITGIITLAAVVIGTLLAAMFGGKVGQRYHKKVDRAGYR